MGVERKISATLRSQSSGGHCDENEGRAVIATGASPREQAQAVAQAVAQDTQTTAIIDRM